MKETDYNLLHQQAVQIRDEVEDGRNTAKRVGKMFVDLVDSQKKEADDINESVNNSLQQQDQKVDEKLNDLGLEIEKVAGGKILQSFAYGEGHYYDSTATLVGTSGRYTPERIDLTNVKNIIFDGTYLSSGRQCCFLNKDGGVVTIVGENKLATNAPFTFEITNKSIVSGLFSFSNGSQEKIYFEIEGVKKDIENINTEIKSIKENDTITAQVIESTDTKADASLFYQIEDGKWYDLSPNKIYLKKVVFDSPTIIDHIVIHSTNHKVGQLFNIAVFNENFVELTTLSGESAQGAGTKSRFYIETGDRGFLGDDTEVSIPQVELCGTYYIAYKTSKPNSNIKVQMKDALSNNGYLTKYATISAVYDCPFDVVMDINEKKRITLSRDVVPTEGNVRVLGEDSRDYLYGWNTSTGKIVKSTDFGNTWTNICSVPAGLGPTMMQIDEQHNCAYYQFGGQILKISSLNEGATVTDITPSIKHSFASTLSESICIAFGYLWWGEYSYGQSGTNYDAENPSKVNNPYLLRYNLTTGVWHISHTFTGGRHVHSVTPDIEGNALYIIVGDNGIGNCVGVHKLLINGIVDGSDNADNVIRYTSEYTASFVGHTNDVKGQDWYNVNAVVGRINGVKCLIGGSDRPLANCVVTKLEDEIEGSAVSFPQCFAYMNQPSTETTWNSIFDSNGWLYGITRETTTSKLLVMPTPYCSVYVLHDFGKVLDPYKIFYTRSNHTLWVKNIKIPLPYFTTSNMVTLNVKKDLIDGTEVDSFDNKEYSRLSKVGDKNKYFVSIDNNSVARVIRRGISINLDVTNFHSIVAKMYIAERYGNTNSIYTKLDVKKNGSTIKEQNKVAVDGECFVSIDVSSLTGVHEIVPSLRLGSGAVNSGIKGYITSVVAYPLLHNVT